MVLLCICFPQELLNDFINSSEWADIIAECDPDYSPCDNEMLGLRNIHVFGLANVLKRPILLVDSVAGMQSSGDYSGEFPFSFLDHHFHPKLKNCKL